jgi:hypothetical protein
MTQKTASSKILRAFGAINSISNTDLIGEIIVCECKGRDILAKVREINGTDVEKQYIVEDVHTGSEYSISPSAVPDIPQDGSIYHLYTVEIKEDGEWKTADIKYYEVPARKVVEQARAEGYTARLITESATKDLKSITEE